LLGTIYPVNFLWLAEATALLHPGEKLEMARLWVTARKEQL
jgi:hypothetical protein